MARGRIRKRVERGFWRVLAAVGVKDAQARWRQRPPIVQRAVPPLVIAGLVILIALALGVPPHPSLLALLGITYVLYLLPRHIRRFALAGDRARPRACLPVPLGERAQRAERALRDPGLQGLPEHGHDGRDGDLRDDGRRAQHRRRLRRAARSRLRRVLRARGICGGMVRLAPRFRVRARFLLRRSRRAGRASAACTSRSGSSS